MPCFPKTDRLLKKSEFEDLLKLGHRCNGNYFALRWKEAGRRRLGIIVPKRAVGLAAKRNRIKRIVREFFRTRPELFPQGDVIVIAREGVSVLKAPAIREELKRLLGKKR